MGLGEFPRGWGAGILLVTRLVMVSCPAGNGKSVGNSQRGIVGYTSLLAGELMTTSPQCPGTRWWGLQLTQALVVPILVRAT